MSANTKIKAFLGLGNPGKEYEKTYHNIGKWVTEKLRIEYQKEIGARVDFTNKTSFMNQSSVLAAALLKNKPYGAESLLVVHDDSDLVRGSYKLVFGGSSAGHKGIQDIIDNLGTEDFWRLRIGVRDPNEAVRRKADEFVLQKWSKADEIIFTTVLEKAWQEMQEKKLV
ncbi:MAG: aminoacyl-tRNA hydrolase [bacterium]|nr:aminoacyl-tRNA hydrolase [bacterium]